MLCYALALVFCIWTTGHAIKTVIPHVAKDGVNGVIVYKVNDIRDKEGVLFHSVCHLNAHFNSAHKYPIVIFSNGPLRQSEKDALLQVTGDANVTFAASSFYSDFFSQPDGLPAGVSKHVKQSILDACPKQNGQPLSLNTKCNTSMGEWPLSYIWMNVWTYHYMWQEPALSSYDYYMYVDSDALVMRKWNFDPFELMRGNNLKFIFNQHDMSLWERGDKDVAEIAKKVFGDLKGKAFDTALNQTVFTNKGELKLDGWGGWFHGGDLRVFRSKKYEEFTRRVLRSGTSHTNRLDQQIVMTMGIAILAQRGQIWSLPAHGYPTSMFHNWFYDSSLNCRLPNGTVAIVEGTQIDAHHAVSYWTRFLHLAMAGNVIINKKGDMFSPDDIEAAKSCQATISKPGDSHRYEDAVKRWQYICYEEYFLAKQRTASITGNNSTQGETAALTQGIRAKMP